MIRAGKYKMDPDEYILFLKIQKHILRKGFEKKPFIHSLLSHGVFPQQRSNIIQNSLSSNSSTDSLLVEILPDLPRHCSIDNLISTLKSVDQPLYRRYKKKIERLNIKRASKSIPAFPTRHDPTVRDNSFINNFYEQLKARTLQKSTLDCKEQFTMWADILCDRIRNQNLPFLERTKIADCAYVLLDLTAVLEKLHGLNKEDIASSPVFGKIEAVVPYTSDPTLSRLTYYARKGVALAQAGDPSALECADVVLNGSSYFIKGRQIGTNIYAVVNILLQHYASLSREEREHHGSGLKAEILHWSNVGMEHFENESEDVWNTWRRVCLDKNVYCHLGIDILSRDIPGVQVSQEDVDIAKHHLAEMETLKPGMEKIRLIHFYVASAKAHTIIGEKDIADGFLRQALAVGNEENYSSEVRVIYEKLHGTPCTSSRREPMEHSEIDENEVVDINANQNSFVRSRPQPCENDSSIGSLCDNVNLLCSDSANNTGSRNVTLQSGTNSNELGADIVQECVNTLSAQFNLCSFRPDDLDTNAKTCTQ